jgi:hypothetical protein
MSQMPEKLAEADVRRADQSQDSTFAGYTRQPPWSTDPDFKWLRSFAPAFFHRHNFFRIVFAVSRKRFRPREKNAGTADEDCNQNEANGFLSRPIVHNVFVSFLITPLPRNQTFPFLILVAFFAISAIPASRLKLFPSGSAGIRRSFHMRLWSYPIFVDIIVM